MASFWLDSPLAQYSMMTSLSMGMREMSAMPSFHRRSVPPRDLTCALTLLMKSLHAVDLSVDPVRRDVGAARAQGDAAIGEARDVGDATGGHGSLARANCLLEGSSTPQEAGAGGGHDLGTVSGDGQLVAFIAEG